MKMRHRISLACFRTLGRDYIQDADVCRQGIGAQFPAGLGPTHLTIEVAHGQHLPVEVKRQAVDTFRQRCACLQVAHCAGYAVDCTAEMLALSVPAKRGMTIAMTIASTRITMLSSTRVN